MSATRQRLRLTRQAANEILSALQRGKGRPSQGVIAAALVATGDMERAAPVKSSERRAAAKGKA